VPSHGEEGVVGLAHSHRQAAVLNPAVVDEEDDVGAGGPMQRGWSYVPGEAQAMLAFAFHRQKGLRGLQAEDCGQDVVQAAAGWGEEDGPALADQLEPSVRAGDGVARHRSVDVGSLRRWPSQELLAGWHVVEEVFHGDHGASGRGCWFVPDQLPSVDAHAAGHLGLVGPGEQGDLGHRGDAGQGLAPKPQAGDLLQVVNIPQFGGGVASEGQFRLVGRDAAAVVRHLDEAAASLANLHADVGGAGVYGVFDEFLDHRGGALDDLAGRDLARDLWWQDLNGLRLFSVHHQGRLYHKTRQEGRFGEGGRRAARRRPTEGERVMLHQGISPSMQISSRLLVQYGFDSRLETR